MDGVMLLDQARVSGLKVWVVNGSLKMKGAKRLGGLAKLIGDNKDDVIKALLSTTIREAELGALLGGDGDKTPHIPGNAEVSSPREPQKVQLCHRLIGTGFPPRPTTIPPNSICATPLPICPLCSSRPVLSELRTMTGGLCYSCWASGKEARP